MLGAIATATACECVSISYTKVTVFTLSSPVKPHHTSCSLAVYHDASFGFGDGEKGRWISEVVVVPGTIRTMPLAFSPFIMLAAVRAAAW